MKGMPPGFAALMRELPLPLAAKHVLQRRLLDVDRHYHGAGHVALLWRRHCSMGRGEVLLRPRWNRRLACAIAFHDAVHDPRRTDNEAASAALWRRCSRHLPSLERAWVTRAILATADHLAPLGGWATNSPSARALGHFLDLDLSPLAERPPVFECNSRRLRREFMHLDDAAWREGQVLFLERMAAAAHIYRSRKMRARLASRARANLARALVQARPV